MRLQRTVAVFWCLLAAGLSVGIQAGAALIGKDTTARLPVVTVVADTKAIARRQGLVNVNGISWNCSGSSCRASAVPSEMGSPLVACQLLAREVGTLRNFSIAKHPINGKELQQCNSVVPNAIDKSAAPAPTPAPAKPKAFSSVALRTPQLTLTGVGVAELTYRFTPVTVRTPPLTLTGVGLAEAVYRFTPVTVRTPPLTVTGTGRSE